MTVDEFMGWVEFLSREPWRISGATSQLAAIGAVLANRLGGKGAKRLKISDFLPAGKTPSATTESGWVLLDPSDASAHMQAWAKSVNNRPNMKAKKSREKVIDG